jgi:hypothetical protein
VVPKVLIATSSRWVSVKRYQTSGALLPQVSSLEAPIVVPVTVVRPAPSDRAVAPPQASLPVEHPSSTLPLQLSSQLLPQLSEAAQQVPAVHPAVQIWLPEVPQTVVQASELPAQQP